MASIQLSVVILSLLLLQLFSGTLSTTFTVTNQCSYTVWPGILSGAGTPHIPETGFIIQPGQSTSIAVPVSWSGRLWGRTLCTTDSNTTGTFSCVTGDCGSGNLQCSGSGATPPATLAEFTLNGAGGFDYYDVSLVDGFNIPMMIAPQGGTGQNCSVTDCSADLNKACPTELQVAKQVNDGNILACKSACLAFGEPQYCCSGAFSTPDKCKPNSYSLSFKNACPKAYSYAYDDGTSTFTCMKADYVITFCPGADTNANNNPGFLPIRKSSAFRWTIGHARSGSSHKVKSTFLGSAIVVSAAVWQLWAQFL